VYGDEPQTLRIVKKGKGAVTGKDIQGNADVEVVNTDQLIATVDDDKASFVVDLVVDTGRGYRTVEESTAKKQSDFIALDTIFSPVLRVRYKVEKTRVGQVTDLDRLSITVDTDGTITSRDAFEEAAAILVNQYTALAGKTRVVTQEAIEVSSQGGALAGASDDSSLLNTSIEDLNLTARTTNALVNNDIHTIQDLFSLSDAELRDLKGFGSKALDEVKDKLAELEL
jgi:DNA-directed RNA polymerase subunit alpha